MWTKIRSGSYQYLWAQAMIQVLSEAPIKYWVKSYHSDAVSGNEGA